VQVALSSFVPYPPPILLLSFSVSSLSFYLSSHLGPLAMVRPATSP